MKKSIIAVVLLVAVSVSAVLYIFKINNVHKDVIVRTVAMADEQLEIDKRSIAKLERELASKKAELQHLREQLAEPTKVISQISPVVDAVKITEKTPEVEEQISKDDKQAVDINKLLETLMENSALQGDTDARKPLSMEEKYSVLLDDMDLSDDNKDSFMELLKRKDALILSGVQKEKIDNDIKSLLGDEDYEEYKKYEQALPTRLFVDDVAVYMAEAGHPLTEDQVDKMMQMSPDMVKDFPLSYSPMSITLNNGDGKNIDDMVEGAIDNTVNKFDNVVKEYGSVLDDDQMEVLDQYMGARFEAKETAAKAATAIMQGDFLKGIAGDAKTSITVIPAVMGQLAE